MKRHSLTTTAAGFWTLAAFSCGGELDLTGSSPAANASGASQNPLVGLDCPVEPAEHLGACATEGSVCGWWTPDTPNPGRLRYSECSCNEASAGELRWNCYYVASNAPACPESPPGDGQSCHGHFGTECPYPERVVCRCTEETGSWSCNGGARQPFHVPPVPPDPGKAIHQLSPTERAAWCDWFSHAGAGPGYPPSPDGPVDEEGFASGGGGCSGGDPDSPFCMASVPLLSATQCEANLALSSCDAPLSELDDCVATLLGHGCWPLGHGCPRYLERPGCSGTIAVAHPGAYGTPTSGPRCAVRVE